MALCIMKRIELAWKEFYDSTPDLSEVNIEGKRKSLESDTKYCLMRNYDVVFPTGINQILEGNFSLEDSIKLLCELTGEIFNPDVSIHQIKKCLRFNEYENQKKIRYEKVYEMIELLFTGWLNFLDEKKLQDPVICENAIETVIKEALENYSMPADFLVTLRQNDCISPFFHFLLNDRNAQYNKRNDSILLKANEILEQMIK